MFEFVLNAMVYLIKVTHQRIVPLLLTFSVTILTFPDVNECLEKIRIVQDKEYMVSNPFIRIHLKGTVTIFII